MRKDPNKAIRGWDKINKGQDISICLSDGSNVKEWTGLTLPETHVLTNDREAWQKLVREINGAPKTKVKEKMVQTLLLNFLAMTCAFDHVCDAINCFKEIKLTVFLGFDRPRMLLRVTKYLVLIHLGREGSGLIQAVSLPIQNFRLFIG